VAFIDLFAVSKNYDIKQIFTGMDFHLAEGERVAIVGQNGCGKSTLLRHLTGLKSPAAGNIIIRGTDFWESSSKERIQLMQRSGVLYQSGALWSSMSIGENVALPLRQFTTLSHHDIAELVEIKLALEKSRHSITDSLITEIEDRNKKQLILSAGSTLFNNDDMKIITGSARPVSKGTTNDIASISGRFVNIPYLFVAYLSVVMIQK